MNYGAVPLRSTRRLSNQLSFLPRWYHIGNSVAGEPTQVSIYDEIGFFGVSAGDFLAELKGVNGDLELHLNSPGGDVHQGISIYNQLRQRKGSIHVIIDGLAASAASFIAQAASPGKLQVAPHAQMMIHNGFSMAIGDAADLRKTADLLDTITGEIASIYAERSGKPADHWLALMAAETWFTDKQAVDEGLADSILGQEPSATASWDLSVFARYASAAASPPDGSDDDSEDDSGPKCPTCKGKGTIRDGHVKCPDCKGTGKAPPDDSDSDSNRAPVPVLNAATQLGDGWVQDPDGKVRFDPDNDGDDDSTAAGDTDHDYWSADGKQLKPIPPKPSGKGNQAGFPVLNADVDNSPWDASKAWSAGAASDDPAAFYKGICAGRKSGDPSTQAAWALPYKYTPSSPPNAAGVKNALSRLPQTQGLTNEAEAKSKLQGLMKAISPGYEPDGKVDTALIASVFTLPRSQADDSTWNPRAALAAAAESPDPAAFYKGICAGRRTGDPATAAAWALPYRYSPASPPNTAGVRAALAELPLVSLANTGEARGVLEAAMKQVSPDYSPDDQIDPGLLAAAFSLGLEGASK